MFCLMSKQRWLARMRFKEILAELVGSWHLRWSVCLSNGLQDAVEAAAWVSPASILFCVPLAAVVG